MGENKEMFILNTLYIIFIVCEVSNNYSSRKKNSDLIYIYFCV